jgi:hypothetical protein
VESHFRSCLILDSFFGCHHDVVKNGGKITLAAIQSSSQVVKTLLLQHTCRASLIDLHNKTPRF